MITLEKFLFSNLEEQRCMDGSQRWLFLGDIGSVRDRRGASSGDRVLLINDVRHSENLVVPTVSPDEERKKFHESREQGVAAVIVALKEHAEFYAQMLVRRGGVRSAID